MTFIDLIANTGSLLPVLLMLVLAFFAKRWFDKKFPGKNDEDIDSDSKAW